MRRILRRMFAFTARLQWKLSLLYTLVTVVVLTLLMISIVFISNTVDYNYPQSAQFMANVLSRSAAPLKTALETNPPDIESIQRWIDKTYQGSKIYLSGEDDESIYTFTTIVSPGTILAVLDARGHVLTSNHPEALEAGTFIAPALSTHGRDLVARVQLGETRTSQLSYQADLQKLAVAPIHNASGELLGMVLLVLERPGQMTALWASILSTLPAIGVATVPAALTGFLFGILTARSLTKRLQQAAQATAAWGQGDFSTRIDDQSQDEIGRLARDLNRMADQWQALMRTRQELAAAEERNRLARDLHDSAKQQVFATSMNLAAVKALWDQDPEEARKRLEIAADLSRKSQHELTTLIQTLRPVQLERQSIAQAICQATRDSDKLGSIRIRCQISEIQRSLSPEVEQALYRVVQEGLSNIHRHSGASEAVITLEAGSDAIILRITDNGRGFDPLQPSRGLGLRSMYERIQALGGTLHIASSPAGTCLTAQVPFKGENENARPDHNFAG